MSLRDVVYHDSFRRLAVDLFRAARARFFSVGRGESVNLVVRGSPEEVVTALAAEGFVQPWLLSYHFEGEDVNLVRFWYDASRDELPYRQDHVRLFADEYPDGKVGLACHEEASSVTHRDAHLDEETFSRAMGAKRVRDALARQSLFVETPPDADSASDSGGT